MNLYEYQRSRSFIGLGPRSLRFTFSNFFSLETARPIEAKFHMEPPWMKICSKMVQVTWPIWPQCQYMVKTLKKIFSRTKRPMALKVGMQHRVLEYYHICSNNHPGFTLTYFMARSNLVPYAFVWEKDKIMDFSETIVVYDIKVGRFSQLNEHMNLYEYQRSSSFIDFRPRSLRFNIFKLLLLRNRYADWSQPPWDVGNENLFKCSRSHYHAHVWWKTSKIFFFGINRPMTLKLGIQHRVLEYYQCFHMMTWIDLDHWVSDTGPIVLWFILKIKRKIMLRFFFPFMLIFHRIYLLCFIFPLKCRLFSSFGVAWRTS